MTVPEWLASSVREIPDFPRPGVLFRDLSPLWASSAATSRCAMALASGVGSADLGSIDLIVGIEARGFLAGVITAQRLGIGFVAARKPGKLPGEVLGVTYDLEYGSDGLEIQAGALQADQRVMIVDDVLATGGTARAAAALVERSGAVVAGLGFVIEIAGLGGRESLEPHRVVSLWRAGG
jgi:adenine phosphoribosyltransferase